MSLLILAPKKKKLLIDLFSVKPVLAFSTRRLSNKYHGPLVRVKDATTSNEKDIFSDTNGNLNKNQLINFLGLNVGQIATCYSQHGQINAIQATLDNMPTIYDGSSINNINNRPALHSDGVNDNFMCSLLNTVPQPFTISMVLNNYTGGTSNANLYRSAVNDPVGYRNGGGANWGIYAGVTFVSNSAYTSGACTRIDVFNGANSQIRSNGIPYVGNSGTLGLTSGDFHILMSSTGSWAQCLISEFIIWPTAFSEPDYKKIEANQKQYYNL